MNKDEGKRWSNDDQLSNQFIYCMNIHGKGEGKGFGRQ